MLPFSRTPSLADQLINQINKGLSSDDSAESDTPIWTPFPGPQTDALNCEADELFFGGASGGGKSYLLLGLAATKHIKSIIFRRELNDVRDMEDISRPIFEPHGASLNQSLHIWRNIPGGRTLEFGGLHDASSYKSYQGRGHDLKAYDEIPTFTREQFIITKAWNRTAIPGQRCRVVCTGNPPMDAEGAWVIEYWAAWLDPKHPNPAKPGELRWYAQVDDIEVECPNADPVADRNGKLIYPRSRTFIPARVEDNPAYMATGYDAVLDSLPKGLRQMLREGNFAVEIADDIWQTIPTAWVLAAQERWQKMEKPQLALRSAGVDVARGGKDKTVIATLYGTYFDTLLTYPGQDTPDGKTAARYVTQAVPDPKATIGVDVIGVGSSVFDTLRDVWQYEAVIPINNGSGSSAVDESGKFGFLNLRAESYWKFREALDPNSGEDIALPPSRELLADLCAPKFKNVGAKYQIEPKADLSKRIGRSPDMGDAVVMAWWVATHSAAQIAFVATTPKQSNVVVSASLERLAEQSRSIFRGMMNDEDD